MKFGAKRFSPLDWAIAGGAGVAFLSAFLPWWGYKGPLLLYSAYVSGWSAGFTAWAGALLLTLAGVYVFLSRSEVAMPKALVGPGVLVAAAAALGLLLVIVRWLTLPHVNGGAAGSMGARYGIWLALIAGIVEVAAATLAFRESGEPLPRVKATPEAGKSVPE